MSPRGRSLHKKRPEASRRQLMAAAIDCFARLGYQGTSIDRIARDAGVTKGAVYYHFRDKEELLFEAVKDRIGGFEKQVLEEVSVSGRGDALTKLRQVVDACFFHATVSNHRRFIITLMIEALDTNPRLSTEFRNILRRMRAFLTEVVRRGQQRGGLRADVDPHAAAAAISGGIIGAEVQHYQDPEEIDLRRALDTLVEQLVSWLAPGSASANVAVGGGSKAW
jgi:AcrR family transcriptional regulator